MILLLNKIYYVLNNLIINALSIFIDFYLIRTVILLIFKVFNVKIMFKEIICSLINKFGIN